MLNLILITLNGKKIAASPETQILKVAVKNGDSLVVIDKTTGKSPNKLMTKKVKKDLQILEEGSDKASVVLEDYYAEGNVVELGGVSQSGSMMTYSVADGGLILTPAATAEAATAASVTAESGFLGSTASYVLGGLAVIGMGVAAAAGGGGSSTPAATDTTVVGTVTAGPVIAGHQLSVKIYQADGTTLLGEATLSETGTFSVNIGTYRGVIIAKVVDAGAGNDYTDEATGEAKDLNATLMATTVVAGGTVTLNINPVTTIAAIEAGLSIDGTGSIASSAAATAANTAVATAFGLTNITTTTPITTLDTAYNLADGMSEGEKYGAILAALSGADQNNGGDMQATIQAVTDGLSGTTLNNSAQSEIIAGANSADANVAGDLKTAVTTLIAPTAGAEATNLGANLSAASVTTLTPAVVASLTNAQVATLTDAQVATLTNEQLAALTSAQMDAMATAGNLDNLTAAQVAALPAATIDSVPAAVMATMSDAQLEALTAAQVAAITPAQIDSLTPAQIAALGADLSSLTPAAMESIDAAQAAAITAAQLDSFDATDVAALAPAAVGGLTPAALASLDNTQLKAMAAAENLDNLSDAQISALPLTTDLFSDMFTEAGSGIGQTGPAVDAYNYLLNISLRQHDATSNDGTANQTDPNKRLTEYINQVTGTDIVSDAEFEAGFSITGHATAGASGSIKFWLDNDRRDGNNQIGTLLVDDQDGVDIAYDNDTGDYTITFAANSTALLQGTHNIYGSGVHQLTVDTNGSGGKDGTEASRIFLVASGTARTTDTGLVSQNYSIQDAVTKDVFVYYYGDPDGNGVGLWTSKDPDESAVDVDRDGINQFEIDLDYYNTSNATLQGEATTANTALGFVASIEAQTWEFHMAKSSGSSSWSDADALATDHTLWNSNTSRLASEDELLALYAANFGGDTGGGGQTVGAIQAISDTSSLNDYEASEDNRPSGWADYFWSSAPTPSDHSYLSLRHAHTADVSDTSSYYVAPVL